MLRGTQIQLDACITRPDNIGVYKAYTKDEVEDEIDFMMRQGFIGRKRRENYYTVYYILTMTAKGKDLLKFLSKADEKDIKWTDTYKIDQIRRYSNQMSNGEVKMLTNAEYLQLVDLCKNPGMISNISEELTSILGKAPESIGQYIQMLSGAESNSHVKRLYKNIISVSKAEKKK